MLLPILAVVATPFQVTADPLAEAFELVPNQLTFGLAGAAADAGAWLESFGHPALAGAEVLRSNRLGIVDLELAPGSDRDAALVALRGAEGVIFAESVWLGRYFGEPNDPLFSSQDHLRNLGQTGGAVDADVDAEHVWDITVGDPSVIIAVLDSGVDASHPDLAPNVWSNPGEIPGNGVDDDGNGFVDDAQGWNFQDGDSDVSGGSHGTWVAGVVGARTGNGVGVAGLAGGMGDQPGCSLMCLGVGAISPISSLIDDAIIYAADNGARVITISLGAPNSAAINSAIDYAVNQQGVFIDCATGNGFFGGGPVSYPATNPDVFAVGGTTNNDSYWTTANFGPETRVAAKAQNVFTTQANGGYEAVSGTSFSAPQVGALAGLILSVNPDLTVEEVGQIIGGTADDVMAPGFDFQTGLGRINAWAAVLAALDPDADGNGAIDAFEIAIGQAADGDGDDRIDAAQMLFPGLAEVSLGGGGTIDFTLDADLPGGTWLMLGSLTAPYPGTMIDTVQLPLVGDAYTDLLLDDDGSFASVVGLLDGAGDGVATLQLPAATAPALAGRVAYHAFLVFDPVTQGIVEASNPAALELLP